MLGRKRLHQPGWLSGTAHIVILAVAAKAQSPTVWSYALLAMAGVSFCAWIANYRRYRQIHDLPTSKIASAAQGYVELYGRSAVLPGAPLTSRLSNLPCCWYHYEVQERTRNNKWQTVDSGSSVKQFLLVDDTGQCVISPDGAEVLSRDHRRWHHGNRRYTEWLLLPQGRLYAIGAFSTVSTGVAQARDERADVGALLAEWKSDPKALHARFDLDGDGTLDIREWELARLQAQRQVRSRHEEMQSRGVEGVHVLRKPADGRLFLLADEVPDRIGNRYRYWSWAHLAVFIGAGLAGLLML